MAFIHTLYMFMIATILKLCTSQCEKVVPVGPKDRDRRPDGEAKKVLNVVNYNVEWLYTYDTSDDGSNTKCRNWDEFAVGADAIYKSGDFKTWDLLDTGDDIVAAKAHSDTHINKIVEYLDILKADIFVFEEVCDCETLEKIRLKLTEKDLYRAYAKYNAVQHQQVGIITKIDPIPNGVNGKAKMDLLYDTGDGSGRPKGFRAEFTIGNQGKKLILYGTHLCASCTSGEVREGSAGQIKAKIQADKVSANNYVLVTGDFNTNDRGKVKENEKTIQCSKPRSANLITQYEVSPKICVNSNSNAVGCVQIADDAMGIKVTDKGNTALVDDSFIQKIEYVEKPAEVTINKPKPTSLADMNTWLTSPPISVDDRAKVVIYCKEGRNAIRSFDIQRRSGQWDWLNNKLYGMTFADDGSGSVKITLGTILTKCDNNARVTKIKIKSQPVNVDHVSRPKTIIELDAVIAHLKGLGDRLAGNIDIVSATFRPEKTLTTISDELSRLNDDCTQDVDKQYSHVGCGDGLGTKTYDFIFASANLKALIKDKMTYEHNGGTPGHGEKVCRGYSDHTPIKVVFKTEGDDHKYANIKPIPHFKYDDKYYLPQRESYFIWFIGMLFSICCACILLLGSLICGSLFGWIFAKEAYYKFDIENQSMF